MIEARQMDRADFFAEHWRPIVRRLTPEIAAHLDAERVACAELLAAADYDTVVETGCADGRLLLPTIVAAGCRYLGVDLVQDAVDEAGAALATAGGTGTVVRADIAGLADLPGLVGDRLLVAFPFNVFGHLDDPDAVLAACAEVGADVAVFTYRTTAPATAQRLRYYALCGVDGPVTTDPTGVLVTSENGFRSLARHPPVLAATLSGHGYHVRRRGYGTLGHLQHGRL